MPREAAAAPPHGNDSHLRRPIVIKTVPLDLPDDWTLKKVPLSGGDKKLDSKKTDFRGKKKRRRVEFRPAAAPPARIKWVLADDNGGSTFGPSDGEFNDSRQLS